MSSYHYSFYSPTDCTAWVFSHRFHCLLRIFSHRFHGFTQKLGCLQGGALVSARLCRLPEQEVHQLSKIDILPRNPQNPQNFLLSVFSHRFHRFTQKLGCLQGGALCCCGGKDTSATIFRTLTICVNLCNLWEALLCRRFCEICVFCGRLHSARVSVQIRAICGRLHPGRVKSVGELSQKLSDYEKKRNFALIARR